MPRKPEQTDVDKRNQAIDLAIRSLVRLIAEHAALELQGSTMPCQMETQNDNSSPDKL